jgi:hypothetical protein
VTAALSTGLAPDPEAPDDLIPVSGQHAVERVFYTSVYLDRIDGEDEDLDKLEDLSESGGLDVAASVRPERMNIGYTRPAVGVMLTLEQSWFAEGVALGQLLHSVALAPGESTRIAIVDWSRRSSAGTTETITEADALSQSTQQARSISEVTNAVASELQIGSTIASSLASTSQASGFSGMVVPFLGNGYTASISNSFSVASNVSTTSGTRNLSADATQRVANSTQQYATATRTRRASVVREVFQSESERLTTRVITNYNHMHALSVQYYEVVQIYRVETRAARAERVLFVPMKAVDFADVRVVEHYRPLLARAARTDAARQLFAAPADTTVRLEFGLPLRLQVLSAQRDGVLREIDQLDAEERKLKIAYDQVRRDLEVARAARGAAITPEIERAFLKQRDEQDKAFNQQYLALNERRQAKYAERERLAAELGAVTNTLTSQARRAAGSLGLEVGSGIEARAIELPQNARLERLSVRVEQLPFQPAELWLTQHNGARIPLSLDSAGAVTMLDKAPALDEFARVDLVPPPGAAAPAGDAGTITVTMAVRAGSRREELSYTFAVQPGSLVSETWADGKRQLVLPLLRASLRAARAELIQHLKENAAYYTQVIWGALDPQTLTQLLANYKYQGRRIGAFIDPTPLAVTGNYIGFRWHFAEGEGEQEQAFEQQWLRSAESQTSVERIPLPSGGVFAEAVLGRFNCAERIDLTRFWNWQDSPIPILPPEIAPLQAASRAQAEDLRPGQLSAPAVQIQAAPALPNPVGLQGVLQSIVAANLFRDMSGQAATIALAQQGLTSTSEAATAGTKEANASMRAFAEHQMALAKEALPLITAATTAGVGGMPASLAGGALNAATKLDKDGGAAKSPAAASVIGSLLGVGQSIAKASAGDKDAKAGADDKKPAADKADGKTTDG